MTPEDSAAALDTAALICPALTPDERSERPPGVPRSRLATPSTHLANPAAFRAKLSPVCDSSGRKR